MADTSREAVISAARDVAARLGVDTLRRQDFFKQSGFTQDQVNRLFPDDGWRGVLEGAGLRVTFQNQPTPDDALLADFHRVVRKMARIPTGIQYESRGDFSFAVYKKRFGGIQGTLTRYRAWLEQSEPDAPELQLVPIKSKHEIVTDPPPVAISVGSQQWAKGSGIVFGAPISFRGSNIANTLSIAPLSLVARVRAQWIIRYLLWGTLPTKEDEEGLQVLAKNDQKKLQELIDSFPQNQDASQENRWSQRGRSWFAILDPGFSYRSPAWVSSRVRQRKCAHEFPKSL